MTRQRAPGRQTGRQGERQERQTRTGGLSRGAGRPRGPSTYRDCYAYQDANYGYGGFYVDRDDYDYYFREGSRRGYEDGYGSHPRDGKVSNGRVEILLACLPGIITYELTR